MKFYRINEYELRALIVHSVYLNPEPDLWADIL